MDIIYIEEALVPTVGDWGMSLACPELQAYYYFMDECSISLYSVGVALQSADDLPF